MGRRGRSVGKVLLGLLALGMALVSLGQSAWYLSVARGLTLGSGLFVGYTLLLLIGGVHALRVGTFGEPASRKRPERSAPPEKWSVPLRITAFAVAAFPLALPLAIAGANAAYGSWLRPRGYFSATKAHLLNFQSAQEIYYGDGHYTYADRLDLLDLRESEGVTLEILEAGSGGFAARTTHTSLPGDVGCVVYAGDVRSPPVTPGGAGPPEPGQVLCDPLPR